MTSLFDKLNLRPGERRLVVIVASVVFVALNVWLVFPHFGDLQDVQKQLADAQKQRDKFKAEIDKQTEYEREVNRLREKGGSVAPDDQSLELMKVVSSQAAMSGVNVQSYRPDERGTSSRTNAFFDEKTLVISASAGEKELVDFLYKLASQNSLIRVRNMTLQPDVPARQRLQANITFVASYQKKPPPKAASTPPPPSSSAKTPKAAPASGTAAKAPAAPAKDSGTAGKSSTDGGKAKEIPKRVPPPPAPPK